MRKIDPALVRANFGTDSQSIIGHFDRIANALREAPTREGDITILATQSFLALFVAFERFLSDLILAYLNRDFSAYQAQLGARIRQGIEAKFSPAVAALVSIGTKAHINVGELEAIVDPTGWNLTFKNVDALKSRAREWLAPAHSQRINNLTDDQERLIDTARAIRNFIAHQSSGSKQEMNAKLQNIEANGANASLGRGANEVHSAGTYLKAYTGNGRRRIHIYHDSLVRIATGL